MKLIRVDENNYHDFRQLLPQIKDWNHIEVVGCLKDNVPCGTLAMEVMGNVYHAFWFYILPEYRKMKIGSALLDTVCAAIKKRMMWELSIDYVANSEYTVLLDYMLAKRGFELTREKTMFYEVKKEELMHSPLWKKEKSSAAGVEIFPLQMISAANLKMLINMAEKNENYLVSREDFLGANSSCSMVFIHEDIIKGVVLMHDMEEEGRMRLSSLYIDASDGLIPLQMDMIREAVRIAVESPINMKVLEFVCINEKAAKFAAYFLPESKAKAEWFCSGVLK